MASEWFSASGSQLERFVGYGVHAQIRKTLESLANPLKGIDQPQAEGPFGYYIDQSNLSLCIHANRSEIRVGAGLSNPLTGTQNKNRVPLMDFLFNRDGSPVVVSILNAEETGRDQFRLTPGLIEKFAPVIQGGLIGNGHFLASAADFLGYRYGEHRFGSNLPAGSEAYDTAKPEGARNALAAIREGLKPYFIEPSPTFGARTSSRSPAPHA